MRTSHALLASVVAVVLGATMAACSPGQDDEPDQDHDDSVAIVEVPGHDDEVDEDADDGEADSAGEDEHADDSDLDTDMHDHTHGDPEDGPEVEEVPEIEQVAGDFFVAMKELRWDHPDGPSQVLEAVEPYVTDRYYEELAQGYEGSGQEVSWVEFAFDERIIDAEVREATFRPDQPFTADEALVWVEGATVNNSPRQRRSLDSVNSVFSMVQVQRTESGWLVDGWPQPA